MRTILITGGAGFIGSNAASWFATRGWRVLALDNFSREGADLNARWLDEAHGIRVEKCDIRDSEAIESLIRDVQPHAILHLAGQVAVTTSLADPRSDFEVNLRGTLNLLEGVRLHSPESHLINASTNKVYGSLSDLTVVEKETRYEFQDHDEGVSEARPLDFQTPYGCSKGGADQYVLDWSRSFGLLTSTVRQSCIYGPRQIGVEDQGWVAWFVRASLRGLPLTIFGNGKQVRDLLYVDDLLTLFEVILDRPEDSAGQAFNAGGGKEFSMSLLELVDFLEAQLGITIPVTFADWRPGDQRIFYSDNRKAEGLLSWKPGTHPRQGLKHLITWMRVLQGSTWEPA